MARPDTARRSSPAAIFQYCLDEGVLGWTGVQPAGQINRSQPPKTWDEYVALARDIWGAPTPTAIDTGTVFITNKRVVFEGPRQTRECDFAKLIGVQPRCTERRVSPLSG